MHVITLMEVIERYLQKKGYNFVMEDEVLSMPGCGWNSATITENPNKFTILCSYAEPDLAIFADDPQLLTKIGKWVTKTAKRIELDHKHEAKKRHN